MNAAGTTYIPVTQNNNTTTSRYLTTPPNCASSFVSSISPTRPFPKRLHNTLSAFSISSHRTHKDVPSPCVFYFLIQKEVSMTKRKDTKAKAFTCRGAAVLITVALLTAAVLFTGCLQSAENQPNIPSCPTRICASKAAYLKTGTKRPLLSPSSYPQALRK